MVSLRYRLLNDKAVLGYRTIIGALILAAVVLADIPARAALAAVCAYVVYFIVRHLLHYALGDRYYTLPIQGFRSQVAIASAMVLLWIAGAGSSNTSQSTLWLVLAIAVNLSAEHFSTRIYMTAVAEVGLVLVTLAIARSESPIPSVVLPLAWIALLTLPLHYAIRSLNRDVADDAAELELLQNCLRSVGDVARPERAIELALSAARRFLGAEQANLWVHHANAGSYMLASRWPSGDSDPAPDVADGNAPTAEDDSAWLAVRRSNGGVELRAAPVVPRSSGAPFAVIELINPRVRRTRQRHLGSLSGGRTTALPRERRQLLLFCGVFGPTIGRALLLMRSQRAWSSVWEPSDEDRRAELAGNITDVLGYECEIWAVERTADAYRLRLVSQSGRSDAPRNAVIRSLDEAGVSSSPDDEAPRIEAVEIFEFAGTKGRRLALPVFFARQVAYVIHLQGLDRLPFSSEDIYLATVLSLVWSNQIEDRLAASLTLRAELLSELHDTVCADLHGIAGFGRSLERLLEVGDLPAAQTELRLLVQLVSMAQEEARTFVYSVRPMRSGGDLINAIHEFIQTQMNAREIRITLSTEGHLPDVDPRSLRLVYRLIREATRNAVLHSRATNIGVLLRSDADSFQLVIRDDGVGFDAAVLTTGTGPDHAGLFMMDRIAGILGGSFNVSNLSPGAEVFVSIPLRRRLLEDVYMEVMATHGVQP